MCSLLAWASAGESLASLPKNLKQLAIYVCYWKSRRDLMRLFGADVFKPDALRIVYAPLQLRSEIISLLEEQPDGRDLIDWPYAKEPRRGENNRIGQISPVSISEVQAANYITAALRAAGAPAPGLDADKDTRDMGGASFIALGSPYSNAVTRAAVDADVRPPVLFDWHGGRPVFVSPTRRCLHETGTTFDHGVITRVCPPKFPRRVWIVCAGHGESGTAGAAYYLWKHWRELAKEVAQAQRSFWIVSVPVNAHTLAARLNPAPGLPVADGVRPSSPMVEQTARATASAPVSGSVGYIAGPTNAGTANPYDCPRESR